MWLEKEGEQKQEIVRGKEDEDEGKGKVTDET